MSKSWADEDGDVIEFDLGAIHIGQGHSDNWRTFGGSHEQLRELARAILDHIGEPVATADALTLDDRRAAFVRGWYEASGQEKLSLAERAWSGLVAAGVVR